MAIYTGSNKHLGGTETVTKKGTIFYGLVQKNVLVTGANGQLGQELQQMAKKTDTPFRFIYTDADVLDITEAAQVEHFISENSIEYIINCAAYTAVDKAETDEELAYKINYTGAENLAKSGAKMIHISTDYVFDGTANIPYKEDASTNPLSVYGKSKLRGEEAVRELADEWIIIRTSWLYSEFGNNFVKTMLRLLNERDELNIVADQRGTPTYAADLAEMILVILECDEWKSGIYHFSNLGETTWFGFTEKIKELAAVNDCRLIPVSTDEYKTAAVRPMYSVLDKSKIQSAFRVVIPQWEDGLKRCLKKLQN
ncbi:MAG TPA: dTDP-4-dehydrorhamnose reductase [Petrimonas sp.]|uniref:dTDP-4-dehydrorhamnose reductase n=1 Tax=Petrimonas sp. TaxID=2023866 RepID=UPI00175C1BDB|nr:dTDP-4-dehydrorhamnose reductase [Petrimonas sp.]